jgi:hypothetical protein
VRTSAWSIPPRGGGRRDDLARQGHPIEGLNLAATYFTTIGFNNSVKSVPNAQSLAETVALTFAY